MMLLGVFFGAGFVRRIVAAGLWAIMAGAQAQPLQEQLVPPLERTPVRFDADVKESIGLFTNIANATFKPAGPGPFPAVVLMHTCGGVRDAHIKQHAQELLEAGFVVLVVDSFGPRGMQNCQGRVLSGSAGIVDAYAALAHLSARPFVDAARVYQVGYSWGAFVSNWLASPQSATYAGSTARFAASVSNYGACRYKDRYQFVLDDSDRPLLMLMGGKDEELPAAPCFPLLEQLKARGAPLQWHLYPDATHAWDKAGQQNRGYVYNSAVMQDATARMLAFLREAR